MLAKYVTKCLYSKTYYKVMQRDLGETAECMKVPFSVPTWERVKIWHLVSKVRKPHPHADKGAEN